MSQVGVFVGTGVPGVGITRITGDNGGAQSIIGDGLNNVNILGAGDIHVNGDGAHTLTISSTGLATTFHTPLGDATPLAGVVNINGTANQIVTAGAGNTITLSLPATVDVATLVRAPNIGATTLLAAFDAAIAHFLQVNGDVNVNGVTVLNNDVNITGNTVIGAGNLGVTAGNISASGSIATTAGNIISAGNITAAHDLFAVGNVQFSSLSTAGGIVQTDGAGILTTSVGTNGQIIIGGASTQWANITSPDGSVTITNGNHSIGLSVAGIVGTDFHTNAGDASPVGNIINIIGGSNINTSGAGNTVTINLDNTISVSGSIAANNNISSTNGNIIASNGNVQAGNGFTTTSGNITSSNGNIRTTNGAMSCKDLTATGNVHLTTLITDGGVLQNDPTGLISSSAGDDGEILIGNSGGAPQWAALTAGAGIAITPGPHSVTITNTGAGGTKAAFSIYCRAAGLVGGDGSTLIIPSANLITTYYDTLGSINTGLAQLRFIAPTTGNYQFSIYVYAAHVGALYNMEINTIYVYAPTFTYSGVTLSGTAQRWGFQYLVNIRLNLNDVVTFGLKAQGSTGKDVSYERIEISGFQIT